MLFAEHESPLKGFFLWKSSLSECGGDYLSTPVRNHLAGSIKAKEQENSFGKQSFAWT